MRTRSPVTAVLLAVALLITVVPAVPAFGNGTAPVVAISEIRIDQPSTDNDEYFELVGAPDTSLDGLTYLVIGDGTGGSGVIESVVELDGSRIGKYGFFVAAESTFGLGTADLVTDLNFENSDNVTHLLVSGFTGSNGQDLDTDDDGTLDVTPWSAELDRIALVEEVNPPSGTEYHYGPPSVGPDGSYVPGHVYRCDDGWHIGSFSPGTDDTPGSVNACDRSTPRINEFVANHTGSDTNEYVEVFADPNADLSAYTLLEIEGDSSLGNIDGAWPIGTTDADGFWSTGFLNNAIENGSMTLLLVQGFTGAVNDDIDADDDGAIDTTFWSAVVDAVAVDDGDAGDGHYAATVLASGFDGVSFVPGGASRLPDGSSRWIRNDYDGAGLPGFSGDLEPGEALNTAGERNEAYVTAPPPAEACGDPFTPIYDVQGSGSSSPLDGDEVSIEGVVVGDFQQADGFNGFHVQDPTGDGDPATSDGVFVYSSSPVSVGDAVRVRGTVDEYYGLTEITSVAQVWLCSTGNTVAPTEVTLPVESVNDFEAYEGMLVTFPQALSISEFYNFDRYGEIVLTLGRQYQPTDVAEPGSAAAVAIADANALGRITLDDGSDAQNPDPARHPNGDEFTLSNRFRGGDLVTNATGVMDYAFGAYKIQPTTGADYEAVNPRPAAPASVGGDLQVATFNVLNFFTNLDDGSDDCGPTANLECRGADNETEYERQLTKIVAGIRGLDAEVVALEEIENDILDTDRNGRAHDPVLTLVEALNAAEGADVWGWVGPANHYNDYPVRNELIYRTDAVSTIGSAIALADDAFDMTRPGDIEPVGRPPLAQTFRAADGGVFTVIANHFKSKGSSCADIGDPEDPDGQANCNLTRVAQAEALLEFAADLQTSTGDEDVLLVGDFNSYTMEDPLSVLEASGYTNLAPFFEGISSYSYLFDGQLGSLDHAFASTSLMSQVTGATVWHINADEPDILDYDTSYKKPAQDALYEPNAYRASDHDPVIVGLDLDYEFGGFAPPIRDENTAKAGRAIPVKFSLGGFFGYDVVADLYWEDGGPVEATTIGGGLKYDWDDDMYVVVVKTDKDWKGDVLTLVLELADGTVHTATFDFR